ncbi:8-oxoguanine deaminase [candidate division KSB3 bacterium]|uniref:8-oxoguanine deaminase n=1 Tax=candidate division KSB3 bacterium TaxID=2044937 RepID=A0A2G6KKS7_9BACT|nr:MAG: 8-oxoguanine deaminase [candidate division KSB3 bacterium]
MTALLLKDCFYIHRSAEEEALHSWDLLIQNNRIKKIAQDISGGAERVIDCSQLVVVPGFVNTHHHFYQTLTRNLPVVQNAELFDWLTYLYEIWKHLDEEAIYYSSLLAMGELLKTGCTTSTDHHYVYPQGVSADIMDLQFQAAERLGIRFSPTRGSMSLSKKDGGLPPDTVVQNEEEILKDSERVIQQYHDSSELSMRKIVLAPCSPFSVTEGLMKESAQLARRYQVRLHTHLAETKDENDYCVNIYGRRPLKLMEDCDFIGDDVFYAHGIYFNDNELQTLSEARSHISHCPSSNMRLGSGICRVTEMLPTNINVALGVDGSASNDTSDMLGELRNALLLQRVKYGAAAVTARDVFKIATINGAKLLNFTKVGEIREGWAADLALFNVHKLEYCGALSDPLAALIFSGYNHGTEYTIVNGNVVVDKGVLKGLDEEMLIAKCNTISHRMINSY